MANRATCTPMTAMISLTGLHLMAMATRVVIKVTLAIEPTTTAVAWPNH